MCIFICTVLVLGKRVIFVGKSGDRSTAMNHGASNRAGIQFRYAANWSD